MEEIQLYETESAHLRFRRLRADDFAAVAAILRDGQATDDDAQPLSYGETVDWLADNLRGGEDGCGWLAATLRDGGAVAALCGLLHGDGDARELRCIVRADLRRQGVGAECAQAMLAYAFGAGKAARVESFIPQGNMAALRTAAACGMKPVGQCERGGVPHLVCAAEAAAKK